jgi:hypothetical protein
MSTTALDFAPSYSNNFKIQDVEIARRDPLRSYYRHFRNRTHQDAPTTGSPTSTSTSSLALTITTKFVPPLAYGNALQRGNHRLSNQLVLLPPRFTGLPSTLSDHLSPSGHRAQHQRETLHLAQHRRRGHFTYKENPVHRWTVRRCSET